MNGLHHALTELRVGRRSATFPPRKPTVLYFAPTRPHGAVLYFAHTALEAAQRYHASTLPYTALQNTYWAERCLTLPLLHATSLNRTVPPHDIIVPYFARTSTCVTMPYRNQAARHVASPYVNRKTPRRRQRVPKNPPPDASTSSNVTPFRQTPHHDTGTGLRRTPHHDHSMSTILKTKRP